MTNVELYMDRRLHLAPTDLTLLQEVGPILKFHLCINQSYGEFISAPSTVWNHRAEFPAAQTWMYLNEVFSSFTALIPPDILSDTVSQIFAYAVESCANPGAAVIDLAVVLTVVHPRASVQIVDSVLIVDEPEMTRGDWVGRAAVESVLIFDDEPEAVMPADIPRRPARRSAIDLKERYLLSASEADNLGDCAVCLDELQIIAGKEVLKMPCSHVFHHRCISKWLRMNDTCPLCRAAIP